MKKAILIFAAVLCLLLTGCSVSQKENSSGIFFDDPTENSAQGSESSSSESKSSISSENIDFPEPKDFNPQGVITQTVLYDKNNVKITAMGLTYNSYQAKLELNIENNTATDLSIRSGTMSYCCNSVNGYMVDEGYLNCDVAAGKKANDTVKFSYNILQLHGINEIADIEIGFNIDASDYSDDTFEEIFTGPCALKTTLAEIYDYSENTFYTAMKSPSIKQELGISVDFVSDEKIYDSNGISVISQVLAKNRDGNPSMLLEVENNTSEALKIRTSDIIVNGLKLCGENYSYDSINAGKKRVVTLNFDGMLDKRYWDACGVKGINSVKATLSLLDSKGKNELASTDLTIKTSGSDTTFSSDGTEIYNKNGLRIISKGFFDGEYDSDDNLYLLLVAANSSAKTLSISDEYDSLSVNGYMSDYYFPGYTINSGETAAFKIRLDGDSLKENKIESVDGIQNVELTIKVKDENYKELDKSVITVNK